MTITFNLTPNFGETALRDLRAEHDAAFATWLTAFEEELGDDLLDYLDDHIWAIETAMRRGAP